MSATTTTNGRGKTVEATEDRAGDESRALTQALTDLKGDLGALRADIDALKRDGLAVGRSSVQAAQDVATAKVQDVRDDVARRVRTVEDDVAAIATDLGQQVQRNPYATLGVAVLGGMLLSRLLKKD